MVPHPIQPKYHHYIPHFILQTFADNFSLSTPNYIAGTSDVFLVGTAALEAPVDKKKKKKRRREYQIRVYQVEDQTTVLNNAGRSYGIEYMYQDIAEDDCMKYEKLLSKMESTSSTFTRKILAGEDPSLTRVQLDGLKKFLFIMKYRSEDRRSQYLEDRFDPETRGSIYYHMRHKGIARIQDVWFDNLKWLIDTPTLEIIKEYKKALISLTMSRTREHKGPIHATELLEFGVTCGHYMCIWEAAKGSEFILSEGCFGNWEGDMSDPFHTFYVVSPRYCLVLVNRLDIWSPARHFRFRSWFEGDIHAFPEAVYKNPTPSGHGGTPVFSPEDVFKYRRIIVPQEDVYFVNSIFLDARTKYLTYNSSVSLYKTLRYYDMMKAIRPDLFKNGYDYSVLRRQLVADMNRTHSS